MENAFLFEIKKLEKEDYQKLKDENIFYSHFTSNQKYYLFGFKKESINLDFIYQEIQLVNQLNSKKRQIRSLRGLILYTREIMESDENYQILNTNLSPFFWEDSLRIINQNKKGGLNNYLFPNDSTFSSDKNYQSEIESLQQEIKILKKENSQLRKELENKVPKLIKQKEELNFRKVSSFDDEELKEIISAGFDLNREKKLPLKKFYEQDDIGSLFTWKKCRIKHESIRQTSLYKNLAKISK